MVEQQNEHQGPGLSRRRVALGTAWAIPTVIAVSAAPAIAASTPETPPSAQQLAQPYASLIQGHGSEESGPLFYSAIIPPGINPEDGTGTPRLNYIDPASPARATFHFSYTDGGTPAKVVGGQSAYGEGVQEYKIDAEGNAYIDLTVEQINKLNSSDTLIDYTILYLENDAVSEFDRPQLIYITFSYVDTLYGYQNVTGNYQTQKA